MQTIIQLIMPIIETGFYIRNVNLENHDLAFYDRIPQNSRQKNQLHALLKGFFRIKHELWRGDRITIGGDTDFVHI